MAPAGRAAVTLAALVATLLLAACGGDDGDESGTGLGGDTGVAGEPESVMRLTLTAEGCDYEGAEVVPDGAFTAELENRSEHYGAFALGELAEGSTLAELEAYLQAEQRRWDETQQLRGPPTYYTQVARVGVAAGDRGLLPADVEPGTYALTCFNDDLPTWRGYVVAQLDVAG